MATLSHQSGDTGLFSHHMYALSAVLDAIRSGEILLLDFEVNSCMSSKQACMLLDSLYRGFPLGGFLFWQLPSESMQFPLAEYVKRSPAKPGEPAPTLVVLNGRERLLALYAAMRGGEIKKYFQEEPVRFEVAFSPTRHAFCPSTPEILDEPEYIPNISVLWDGESPRLGLESVYASYVDRLAMYRDIGREEAEQISSALSRLERCCERALNTQTIRDTASIDVVDEISRRDAERAYDIVSPPVSRNDRLAEVLACLGMPRICRGSGWCGRLKAHASPGLFCTDNRGAGVLGPLIGPHGRGGGLRP